MSMVALITGGSRGIGAAAARALARDGFRVHVGYVNEKAAAERVAEEISGRACRFDVSSPEKVRAAMLNVGDVDVLVNNAGIAHYGLFSEISDDDLARVLGVNLSGAALCARAVIPGMVGKKQGVIINIASIWGRVGASCEAAYSASKAGLIGLTLALAKELGPSGIRVNCVYPGVIETDMISELTDTDRLELAARTPLGRIGSPGDAAELIAFLASDRASFITGQVIGVDGGFSG